MTISLVSLAVIALLVVMQYGCGALTASVTNAPDYRYCPGMPGWCAETKLWVSSERRW